MAAKSEEPASGGRTARRLATDAEAAAISNVTRLRILRLTADDSMTNRQLADRLGIDPANCLRHVRRLVDTGFLVAEPSRRGNRGAREIPYRSTGLSWRLNFDEVDAPTDTTLLQTFLIELAEAGGVLEGQVRTRMWLTGDERAEFDRRLLALLDEVTERGPHEGATRWSIFIGIHRDA